MALLLSFDEKYDPQNGRPKWPDFWNFLANPRISIPCWDWSDEILRKLLLACLLHQWFLHFHFQIYLRSVPLIMKISILLTQYVMNIQKPYKKLSILHFLPGSCSPECMYIFPKPEATVP